MDDEQRRATEPQALPFLKEGVSFLQVLNVLERDYHHYGFMTWLRCNTHELNPQVHLPGINRVLRIDTGLYHQEPGQPLFLFVQVGFSQLNRRVQVLTYVVAGDEPGARRTQRRSADWIELQRLRAKLARRLTELEPLVAFPNLH